MVSNFFGERILFEKSLFFGLFNGMFEAFCTCQIFSKQKNTPRKSPEHLGNSMVRFADLLGCPWWVEDMRL